MNRWIALLGVCFLSTTAFAKATLRMPVVLEGGKDGIPAAEINKKLKKVGAPQIPTVIEISTGDDAYRKFKELDALIDKSVAALGAEYKNTERDWEFSPGKHDHFGIRTCYTGNPTEVADIVGSLADINYSDQLNIWGYKYKKTTKILADDSEGTTNDFLTKESKLWKEWRGQGEAVLILTAYSDDGDDVNEDIITRCF